MNDTDPSIAAVAKREAALFLVCLLFGLLVLPAAIYWVGLAFFGDYGGNGFGAFYGNLHSSIRQFDPVVWFLVLSPWLVIQCLRLTVRLFHAARPT